MLSGWLQAVAAPMQIVRKSGSARGSSPIRAVPEEDQDVEYEEEPEEVSLVYDRHQLDPTLAVCHCTVVTGAFGRVKASICSSRL